MKIICVYCGNLLDLEEKDIVQCNNCGFLNTFLTNNQAKKVKTISKISLDSPNGRSQYAFPPFDNNVLNKMGSKQKKAISKFLNKEKLTKADYDLLLKLAQSKEWERVTERRDKLVAQEMIYAFFNKYYKNINKFNIYKRAIKKIHNKLIQFIEENKEKPSDDTKKMITTFKDQYLDIINLFPYNLRKSQDNIELINSINIELKEFESDNWLYSIPLLSLIRNDPNLEEIKNQQENIEKILKKYLNNNSEYKKGYIIDFDTAGSEI